MKPPSTITMRDVAHAAGVAASTVSKALRNDPTIPGERREAIKTLARELGYTPHPMVSALMSQLHHQRRRSDPYSIAWLDLWSDGEKPISLSKPLLEGARKRSRELGYGIEVFRVVAEGLDTGRLRQILLTRNQRGIIIPPVPESAMHFPMDLESLTGVTIGTSLHHPVMHKVAPNHFQSAQLAMERLHAMGFQRIGLVLSPAKNHRVEGKWLGAYLAAQYETPADERLPPLFVGSTEEKRFTAWLRDCRPDAILMGEQHVLTWTERLPQVRGKQPLVACLAHEITAAPMPGINCQPERIAATAVEMVVRQLHDNDSGSPSNPYTVFIDGVWVEK